MGSSSMLDVWRGLKVNGSGSGAQSSKGVKVELDFVLDGLEDTISFFLFKDLCSRLITNKDKRKTRR